MLKYIIKDKYFISMMISTIILISLIFILYVTDKLNIFNFSIFVFFMILAIIAIISIIKELKSSYYMNKFLHKIIIVNSKDYPIFRKLFKAANFNEYLALVYKKEIYYCEIYKNAVYVIDEDEFEPNMERIYFKSILRRNKLNKIK